MHIKIDEQLSQLIKKPLIEAGYEDTTVYDQGLSGKLDDELWPIVQNHKQFLLTADKEFADIYKFPPGSHNGVLLLRSKKGSILSYIKILKAVLNQYSLEDLLGNTVVATPGKIRIREEMNFEF